MPWTVSIVWREGDVRMSPPPARALFLRLLCLAILVLVPPLVLSAVAMSTLSRTVLDQGRERKAAAVGDDVAHDIGLALSHGVPLEELVGFDDLARSAMAANPEMRYVVVADPAGRVLFARGIAAQKVESHYRAADAETDAPMAAIGSFFDLARPILSRGSVVGTVHVGLESGHAQAAFRAMLRDALMLAAAAVLVVGQAVGALVAGRLALPLARIAALAGQARNGVFPPVPAMGIPGAAGRLARGLSLLRNRAEARYRLLLNDLDEVREDHFNPAVAREVTRLGEGLRARFRFPAALPDAAPGPAGWRLALFLFALAEGVSRPYLPLDPVFSTETALAPLAPSAGGMAMAAWVFWRMAPALPLVAFLATAALVSVGGGAFVARWGRRPALVVAVVPALVGLGWAGFVHEPLGLVVCRAAIGWGYGLMIAVGRRERRFAAEEGWSVLALAGLAGTMAGGVVAGPFGPAGLSVLATLLAVLAWGVGRAAGDSFEFPADRMSPCRFGRAFRLLLANRRYVLVLLGCDVTARVARAAVVFVLAPVWLHGAGVAVADIAALSLLYWAPALGLAPLARRLARRPARAAGLAVAGGLVAALGMLGAMLAPGIASWAAMLLGLGLGQGVGLPAGRALLAGLAQPEAGVMGTDVLALWTGGVARLGAALGVAAVAVLLAVAGPDGALALVGGLCGAGALTVAVVAIAFDWFRAQAVGTVPETEPPS